MKKKPHILITNDDGINAPGIMHLCNSLSEIADITIVAPEGEQSARGLAITLIHPLRITPVKWPKAVNAFNVNGTPADCIRLALTTIMKTPPDLVVSGINRGSNHGRSLLYSGTVGGVIEGTFRGIPGIAFSSFDYYDTEYLCFESYIPTITHAVLEHKMPSGTLLNVNFPSTNGKGSSFVARGVKLTRQGRQYWTGETLIPVEGGFMFDTKLSNCVDGDESDSYWLNQGYITAAPVHVDELTDWRYFKDKKIIFENL